MTDKELIDAVATEVMGWHCVNVMGVNHWLPANHLKPHYNDLFITIDHDTKTDWNPLTDANHWMMVIEKMKTIIFSFKIWAYAQGVYTATFTCDIQGDAASYQIKHKSIGHAVCLAALNAVRGN